MNSYCMLQRGIIIFTYNGGVIRVTDQYLLNNRSYSIVIITGDVKRVMVFP